MTYEVGLCPTMQIANFVDTNTKHLKLSKDQFLRGFHNQGNESRTLFFWRWDKSLSRLHKLLDVAVCAYSTVCQKKLKSSHDSNSIAIYEAVGVLVITWTISTHRARASPNEPCVQALQMENMPALGKPSSSFSFLEVLKKRKCMHSFVKHKMIPLVQACARDNLHGLFLANKSTKNIVSERRESYAC